jgi:tRNA(Ile)-lysidine synthase
MSDKSRLPDSPVSTQLAVAWETARRSDVGVLLAVSGGADSVAMLRGLVEVRNEWQANSLSAVPLLAAHFNHQLRGAESDADQDFVSALCSGLGVELVAERATSDLIATQRDGLESTARKARYAFLEKTAQRVGARYVLTAHTADDEAETILHRILRGTGLAGLGGIPRVRQLSAAATLLRPLLSVTRTDVIAFLSSLNQPFREDQSNSDTRYTRNRLRNELLPLLERDYNPQVREALVRLGSIAVEVNAFLDEQAEQVLMRALRPTPEGGMTIQFALLDEVHVAVARQALILAWRRQGWPERDMGFYDWENLRCMGAISDAAPQKCRTLSLPGGIRAEKQGGVLRLTRPA